MLMALFVLSCTSDETLSNTDSLENVPVSLAMNVSTNNASTRMSAAVTQQKGQVFRGIQDQRLFPFAASALVNNLIASAESPLSTYITNLNRYNEEADNLHYFDDRSVKVPNGTVAFLCYCRATPSDSKFENGSLITNIIKETAEEELDWSDPSITTANIQFEPEKIYTATTNNAVTVPDAANTIADYLTAIANAIPDNKRDFFHQFVNNGHPMACSSTNVVGLEAWAESNGVTLPTPRPIDFDGYPASISLPDGAAVVQWNYTSNKFEAQVQTNTDVNNINSLNRFVYPPELFYYANSRIKTSRSIRKQDYSKISWEDVLKEYDDGFGEMDFSVHSVAIIDPLSYAVGCLQVGLNVQSNLLEDAAGNDIPLTDASFPLTAVLISSQFAQGYDFTPKGADEYIIYDKTIEGGISMGGSIVSTPTIPSKYTNTLVLQTKDNKKVRFALEFTNDSGQAFEGINGKVFDGTKFYLVGTIEVPAAIDQDNDFKKRVFTKNHITKGVVTISSLKEAYTYLPDLLDPRLEVGIQLVPNWIQVTTTNVPL